MSKDSRVCIIARSLRVPFGRGTAKPITARSSEAGKLPASVFESRCKQYATVILALHVSLFGTPSFAQSKRDINGISLGMKLEEIKTKFPAANCHPFDAGVPIGIPIGLIYNKMLHYQCSLNNSEHDLFITSYYEPGAIAAVNNMFYTSASVPSITSSISEQFGVAPSRLNFDAGYSGPLGAWKLADNKYLSLWMSGSGTRESTGYYLLLADYGILKSDFDSQMTNKAQRVNPNPKF